MFFFASSIRPGSPKMKRSYRALSAVVLFAWCMALPAEAYAATGRGLFVSVIQDPPVLTSRESIRELVSFCKTYRIDTLFFQIYRSNQAWFPSTNTDDTPYRQCRKLVSEDPLALLINEAHGAGIRVHAWLNLLSLGDNDQAKILQKYGPEILTTNRKKKSGLKDYRIDGQYFLEPGDPRVRQELVTVVTDVLRAYPDLDGVQYDYIRYPDAEPYYGYTRINMARFKTATGCVRIEEQDKRWKDWKRQQVTELLTLLADKARSVRPGIIVSSTGCASYTRAYYEAFQDWAFWIRKGAVDFVTVMTYTDSVAEFQKILSEARSKTPDTQKVNVGVGAYKLGKNPELFEGQWALCEASDCRECVVFHYGSLLEHPSLRASLTKKASKTGTTNVG